MDGSQFITPTQYMGIIFIQIIYMFYLLIFILF